MKIHHFIKHTIVLATLLIILSIPTLSHAQIARAVGTGEAIIENENMRTAYKEAIQNALLDSIREYYENSSDNSSNIPDITPEYLKFIKSYRITSRDVDEYKIYVGVDAALDSVTLNDAHQFINKQLDTAVYTFNSIASNISDSRLSSIINKSLQAKNFSTMDQNNFSYLITDSQDDSQTANAFNNINSKYMFKFKFDVKYPTTEESDNICQIDTFTNIDIKNSEERALKISTASKNPDKQKCVMEALNQAVKSTLDYARKNIIQNKPENSKIYTYQIKIVNFKNMVSTNKFISALAQKGFINTYKPKSFSSEAIILNVESIFNPDDLTKKIQEAGLNNNVRINTDDKGLLLDFNPQ